MDELRILVVEDLHDTADSLVMLLQLWGYNSTVVYEGKKAIEVAPTLCPDVVFLDIGLPDVNGYEVARQLRRMPEFSKTLLVAISGYGQPADIQRCREVGINLHFLKPADPERVERVLKSLSNSSTPAVLTT